MSSKETATASTTALALRKLVRAGSVKQLAFAARDAAAIVVVGVGAYFLAKPLGIVIVAIGVLLFALFAVFVLTSGARLEKAMRDSGRISSIVVANTTKRASLARLWVLATDNRSVTVPLVAADADVAAVALSRVVGPGAITRFDDENAARAEVKRLSL
jgi:hypothetical protein